jgi:predicted metal-dependent hydrolase
VPDHLTLNVEEGIALAQRYLDDGRPFHAHEVLEALWKTRPRIERDLWQGLAQLAVGVTHALRGNRMGAVRLLRRGEARVRNYAGDPHGIDIAGVLRFSSRLADQLSDEMPDETKLRADVVALRLRRTTGT